MEKETKGDTTLQTLITIETSGHKDRWKSVSERATGLLLREPSVLIEKFSIAFTANRKRQAEISRLPKTREIYLVSAYILLVSHSNGASTKNREIS